MSDNSKLTCDEIILRAKGRVDQRFAKYTPEARAAYDMIQQGLINRMPFEWWGYHESKVCVFIIETIRESIRGCATAGLPIDVDQLLDGAEDMVVNMQDKGRSGEHKEKDTE